MHAYSFGFSFMSKVSFSRRDRVCGAIWGGRVWSRVVHLVPFWSFWFWLWVAWLFGWNDPSRQFFITLGYARACVGECVHE